MMSKWLLTLALSLGLIATWMPVAAAETYDYKGKSVDALFRSTNDSGCVETIVAVVATKQKVEDTGTGETSGSWVLVSVSKYDTCTSTLTMSATGVDESPELKVDKQLDTASLTAKVAVIDLVSGDSFNLKVDLSWEAIAPEVTINQDFDISTESVAISGTIVGTARLAEAKGKVAKGDHDYAKGHSDVASIQNLTEGSVTIG